MDRGGARATSYADLAEMSARLAAWLLKQGIGKEKLVAIRVPRGVDFIACRLATMMVGGAWVGVEEMMGSERIEYIIKDSGAVLTIDEEAFREGVKEEPLPPEQWADPDPHDMAFIFYTSGSTGKAKGAVQEYGIYRYIMDSTLRAIDKWDFLDYANVAPETYIGGIDLMVGALQAGHTLHLIPLELVRDPAGLLKYFKEQHITGSCMPPTLIKVLESIGGLDLKILHVTGEITTELYIDRFPVRNAYGPTELSYLPFFFEIDKPYSITPIGTPDKNTEVLLINENGEKDPNEGMLCIHLPYFRGYLHDKERAGLITIDGKPYFKTGDYTSLDSDGNYTILGRMDDMVKINGNRIEPSEVEFAIKKVLGTDFAAVKAWDRGGSQYLCAYHTCGKELDAAEMAEKLKDHLPLYMIPACYISLDEIPLNENGKVNKMVLPRPDESALFAPYAPPENVLQKKLCAAFADALKLDRERYGIDDDFFLLGGDSLAAIRVITQVEHSDLTVIMIYRERTVRGIDRALQSIRKAAKEEPVGREFPLSDLQLHFFIRREVERPGKSLFNQPLLLSFSPDIDENKLAEAVRRVFSSHPALLTVIRKEGENWIQRIVLENNTEFTAQPISEEELKEEEKTLVQPFSLDGKPLFRRRLFRTDERVVLFLDFHHIICDGYSLRIVGEDIIEAYRGREIPEDAWTELLGRNTVYGEAQRKADKDYFERVYGEKYDSDQYSQVPLFDKEEEGHLGEEEIYPFVFRTEEAREAAKRMKISMNAFYILATALSLMAYNNAENAVFLWTFNGRAEIKAMRTVGLLLRDFPVDLSLDKVDTIRAAVSSINRQIREAILHGSFTPFADGEPLDFLYQGDLFKTRDYEELIDIDSPETQEETAMEPIELHVYEDDDGSRLHILYDAGLYRKESMNRFATIFESVCRLLMADGSEARAVRDIISEAGALEEGEHV
ncbi:MAG: AMP-binding protein [Lachnospiraceae bacterium]|nr:AMP-binding protein [Lachnospiraceae bacterium]